LNWFELEEIYENLGTLRVRGLGLLGLRIRNIGEKRMKNRDDYSYSHREFLSRALSALSLLLSFRFLLFDDGPKEKGKVV
jgi:hypothetical protein